MARTIEMLYLIVHRLCPFQAKPRKLVAIVSQAVILCWLTTHHSPTKLTKIFQKQDVFMQFFH